MRCTAPVVLMAWVASAATASAAPITPSAPGAQLVVERMRAAGKSERDIAAHSSSAVLAHSSSETADPFFAKIHSLAPLPFHSAKRDTSGDISPGSLDSPSMLLRTASPGTRTDAISAAILGVLSGADREKRSFAYEGKESELRRPQGMRHWG